MRDLSTVREQVPEIQSKGVQVMLLNIHESPAQELLAQFEFVSSPTYLIYGGDGNELFRSNSIPTVDEIVNRSR